MTRFGDFDVLCRDTPSYTWCNLFYRQILDKASDVFTNASLPTFSAGLGVNPTCAIRRMGHDGSLGNIANIVVCALSMVFTAVLIWVTNKRKAAVGEYCSSFPPLQRERKWRDWDYMGFSGDRGALPVSAQSTKKLVWLLSWIVVRSITHDAMAVRSRRYVSLPFVGVEWAELSIAAGFSAELMHLIFTTALWFPDPPFRWRYPSLVSAVRWHGLFPDLTFDATPGGIDIVSQHLHCFTGRIELRTFLSLYFLTLPAPARHNWCVRLAMRYVPPCSFLAQGSTALVVLTAIHAGVVAALFWALLANALVATQVVEDGTPSSLIPFYALALAFFAATTYISLDIGLSITTVFGPSKPPQNLGSIPLFVLTSIWPAATVIIYFGLMAYIVLAVLNEVRPMWFYILSAALFVLSQLDYFLLNKVICKGSNQKVDGSFVATFLETAAVGVLYLAWKSITEESWDEDAYYPS
ncbi:hypothetical protein MVEN_01563600 [Mycena venus]|uniref:Chitin synthase export chaperone n=1 Tax=Mycena venus TaxID=2733690 RepID=A0A8H6XSE2_9AGAR|nr:hypothetical protein MVEN_01563600 [Mycena venus]